jgi:manganese efflux pump family protein
MGFFSLLLLAIGLSMDAFAVSICKGLSMKKMNWGNAIKAGLYFGIFQAIMPSIGFFLGSRFEALITDIDHWIAFVLLALIGGNMIRESFGKEEQQNGSFDFKTMFLLAVATSIDALAVGVTFAFLNIRLLPSVTLIGCTTFLFSFAGVKIGNVFGAKYEKKAGLTGGIILIIIAFKILLEHLGILVF